MFCPVRLKFGGGVKSLGKLALGEPFFYAIVQPDAVAKINPHTPVTELKAAIKEVPGIRSVQQGTQARSLSYDRVAETPESYNFPLKSTVFGSPTDFDRKITYSLSLGPC